VEGRGGGKEGIKIFREGEVQKFSFLNKKGNQPTSPPNCPTF